MKALINDPWVVNAASAVVVAAMVIAAAAMGFRQRAKIDHAALLELALAEGQTVEDALVAPNGSAGVARLSSGALLVVRAMADGVSSRIVNAETAQARVERGYLTITIADVGFPPLQLPLKEPAPPWVVALAKGV